MLPIKAVSHKPLAILKMDRVMQFPVSSKSLYFIFKLNSSLYPLEHSVQVTNLNTNVWLGGQNGDEVLVVGFDTK